MMQILIELVPAGLLLGVFLLMAKLVGWAKKGKVSAIALGVLVQMFTPDPNVQKTIAVVMEQREVKPKQQQEDQNPQDQLINK